jgi:hypothetical protein
MAHYDNTNKFTLFRAKKNSEKSPDYSGEIDIDGLKFRLAAWKRTSKSGIEYISGAVSSVDEEYSKKPKPDTVVDPDAVDLSEIPF